jgi:hypothetical protein
MKSVVFTRHARQRLAERSTTEEEVIQTIRSAPWIRAEQQRFAATKWYSFGQEHEGVFYVGKDVRPIFVDEADRIVIVTLYVYFNPRSEP